MSRFREIKTLFAIDCQNSISGVSPLVTGAEAVGAALHSRNKIFVFLLGVVPRILAAVSRRRDFGSRLLKYFFEF